MEEEFVPYELAVKLKALGFDEPCMSSRDMNNGEGLIQLPLYQQAFRWFREKYDLQASNIMFSNGKYDTGITRYKGTQSVWGNGPIYDTYEEAELACLKKLIEIVKDGK